MRMYPTRIPIRPSQEAESGRRNDEFTKPWPVADCRGFVFYEWRRGYGHIELDFAVWIEGPGPLRPAGEGRPLPARSTVSGI